MHSSKSKSDTVVRLQNHSLFFLYVFSRFTSELLATKRLFFSLKKKIDENVLLFTLLLAMIQQIDWIKQIWFLFFFYNFFLLSCKVACKIRTVDSFLWNRLNIYGNSICFQRLGVFTDTILSIQKHRNIFSRFLKAKTTDKYWHFSHIRFDGIVRLNYRFVSLWTILSIADFISFFWVFLFFSRLTLELSIYA